MAGSFEYDVIGVLAGDDLPLFALNVFLQKAKFIIAADGAANRCIDAGVAPDLIVGDLDSLREVPELGEIPRRKIEDQNTTDADKLLDAMREFGSARMAITGLEGNLHDHTLAAYASIFASKLSPDILFRRGFGGQVLCLYRQTQRIQLFAPVRYSRNASAHGRITRPVTRWSFSVLSAE